jgi:peptidoglycan hydrolase CwlO-like protein
MRHLEAELVKVCVRGRERQEVNERHAELNAARVKVNQKLETLKAKSLSLKKMQKDLDERAQEAEVWE